MIKFLHKVKYFIIKLLLTENEKCMLNQALNEQAEETYRDYANGFSCLSSHRDDMKELRFWQNYVCNNNLWD